MYGLRIYKTENKNEYIAPAEEVVGKVVVVVVSRSLYANQVV